MLRHTLNARIIHALIARSLSLLPHPVSLSSSLLPLSLPIIHTLISLSSCLRVCLSVCVLHECECALTCVGGDQRRTSSVFLYCSLSCLEKGSLTKHLPCMQSWLSREPWEPISLPLPSNAEVIGMHSHSRPFGLYVDTGDSSSGSCVCTTHTLAEPSSQLLH